jgi:prepilin-type processing-associated H-X9-DG protein
MLTSVGPTVPSSTAKTSALAVMSMILGILSFCTFFITAPLAIIFGIISLIMIVKSNGRLKGIGFAVTGLAVPIVALPFVAISLGIMLPAPARARSLGQRAVCMSNLKQLGVAAIMYADNNKRQYPPADKWCDLLEPYYKNNSNVLICPATIKSKWGYSKTNIYTIDPNAKHQCSYAINPNAKRNCRFPATTVLFFESNPGWNQSGGAELLTTQNHNGGCNVLFCDGHVDFVRAEKINDLRWTADP